MFTTINELAHNHCAPAVLIRHARVASTATVLSAVHTKIPGGLFWICGCLYVQRPLGSKWKHPSWAAPPASAGHSIDVEKASSLITFHIAGLMEFGGVVVIRAELNCMKLFNGPLMINPFTWLMWCEAGGNMQTVKPAHAVKYHAADE